SFFVNEKRWADLPEHLKGVVMSAIESGHHYRNQWYWGGEAKLRATGDKLKLRSIPQNEWREVEDAADKFWQEISETGETAEKIVNIFRDYRKVINSAGIPYSFS
ncbi:C4-dicarboxylate ABC transporter, partial [Candidatus Pelagibacter sp.]|nr:C4-dicarboxylate ABC transporter [Candidatus Pelagibacter sp.]